MRLNPINPSNINISNDALTVEISNYFKNLNSVIIPFDKGRNSMSQEEWLVLSSKYISINNVSYIRDESMIFNNCIAKDSTQSLNFYFRKMHQEERRENY